MRVAIGTLGTAGDVHPYIAVGIALKRRGHQVVMLANPHFKERINGAGLGFWPVGTAQEYAAFVGSPDLVNPGRSVDFVLRNLLLGTFDQQVSALNTAIETATPDVVLNHHICIGFNAVCEVRKMPHVQGVLAPLFWLSRHERLALPNWPRPDAPWFVHRIMRKLLTVAGSWSFDGPINKARRKIGAVDVDRAHVRLARGGDGVHPKERITDEREGIPTAALWSEAFRPTMPDDPLTGTICGFCSWDRPSADPALLKLEEDVLAWMGAAEPPVLVTLGSSVSGHGGEVYDLVIGACDKINMRVLLLTGRDDVKVNNAKVRAVNYVPYSRVMPRASVIVHHSGIGTTAAAMRAGRPSVIIPFANDEFDNATRARRLGVATVLKRKGLTERQLAEALKRVACSKTMMDAAENLGRTMQADDGPGRAADLVERTAKARRVHGQVGGGGGGAGGA